MPKARKPGAKRLTKAEVERLAVTAVVDHWHKVEAHLLPPPRNPYLNRGLVKTPGLEASAEVAATVDGSAFKPALDVARATFGDAPGTDRSAIVRWMQRMRDLPRDYSVRLTCVRPAPEQIAEALRSVLSEGTYIPTAPSDPRPPAAFDAAVAANHGDVFPTACDRPSPKTKKISDPSDLTASWHDDLSKASPTSDGTQSGSAAPRKNNFSGVSSLDVRCRAPGKMQCRFPECWCGPAAYEPPTPTPAEEAKARAQFGVAPAPDRGETVRLMQQHRRGFGGLGDYTDWSVRHEPPVYAGPTPPADLAAADQVARDIVREVAIRRREADQKLQAEADQAKLRAVLQAAQFQSAAEKRAAIAQFAADLLAGKGGDMAINDGEEADFDAAAVEALRAREAKKTDSPQANDLLVWAEADRDRYTIGKPRGAVDWSTWIIGEGGVVTAPDGRRYRLDTMPFYVAARPKEGEPSELKNPYDWRREPDAWFEWKQAHEPWADNPPAVEQSQAFLRAAGLRPVEKVNALDPVCDPPRSYPLIVPAVGQIILDGAGREWVVTQTGIIRKTLS